MPLPLHLAHAMLWAGGQAAADASPERAWDALRLVLRGMEMYRRHPFRRPDEAAGVLTARGTTRLLDYGGSGRPVVAVPSLVNPAYVLDLLPERSLLAFLRRRGLRPLLVDWGAPGAAERRFDLADYAERLADLIEEAAEAAGRPVALIGYCMGGVLTLAAQALKPLAADRLALLAVPWDFHAAPDAPQQGLAAAALSAIPLIEALGHAPEDLVQAFFAALDPSLVSLKFSRFATMDPASTEARLFVALEDWANEGAPLAGPAAVEVLRDWYALNLPASGQWRVRGKAVDPAGVDLPVFAAVPHADRIVPPQSALALVAAWRESVLVRPSSGHVGMIVGRRAETELWRPLADWLSRVS